METVLERLGLQKYYTEKLSRKRLLQIDSNAITDQPPKSSDVVWVFLKKLMMVNVTVRNVEFTSQNESFSENSSVNIADLVESLNSGDKLSIHDIVTALFLCSDAFVQQELSLKMSLCQFAVPLLLPNIDTNQCTLMLWALRDIVKKYRPESEFVSKGFKEERIVHSKIPMFSFVKLGSLSSSKSEILNKLLSNPQQYHNFFAHHNMQCGDTPRTISDGLVEITWYLPCGNKNIDIFNEPVAIANLRGDMASFESQFSFLCQTSSAVFVFLDNPYSNYEQLMAAKDKVQLFIVANQQSRHFSVEGLQSTAEKLGLTNKTIILKTKTMNDAEFVRSLQQKMRDVIKHTKTKMSVEQMASVARKLRIPIDEDFPECQNAKQKADAITSKIDDIPSYKDKQLPRQGKEWMEVSLLEKEEIRLNKVGQETNLQHYLSELVKEKDKLRKKQKSYEISEAMSLFVTAISAQTTERSYFLKWMRMNLDNLSLEKLSGLREQFKEQSKIPNNKEKLMKIDEQLSNSSLGIEHFIREMSQIYEAEKNPSNSQFQHLPKLCANLLLEGFPLELVDGDASNIPLTWVSNVLVELSKLVSSDKKIQIVTVLGVQSTGKSTLLNTMFGVQFAVSSGRCTRGAYMLLIQIGDDMKTELNCDFLVIIDTEGLKSPELAQLDNSYEHDNELATLVVGLSDITIINIAMENAVEMKDTLQIVVHAFLRMTEVGKKPKCQFVHQNVSDVSAHEKNLRDRKKLLEQLDIMTQAAAKMEKKENNQRFTDVMEYNPDSGNLYIPGLWNGTPPMAPVNVGYSEAVYELKKNVLYMLSNCAKTGNTILDFKEWINSLWTAVKHENFIFSFKNSLVADAYMKLCTEFNKWEWEFKKHMYKWSIKAETRIRNIGLVNSEESDKVVTELQKCIIELEGKLNKHGQVVLNKLSDYFKKKDGHVHLVEKYKQEFQNSVDVLKKETKRSVTNHLTATVNTKKGMAEVERIKKEHMKLIETQVFELIEKCRNTQDKITDQELQNKFDNMWNNILKEFKFIHLQRTDVFNDIYLQLIENLHNKGSHVSQLLSKHELEDGKQAYTYSVEGLRAFKENMLSFFKINDIKKTLQVLANKIIEKCEDYVDSEVGKKTDYHVTYIEEILRMIDDELRKEKDVHNEFEVSLKQHICANAARKFQKMHDDFLELNDPLKSLGNNKDRFYSDFKDVFRKTDNYQRKAEEFTVQGLTPAVEAYINNHLGSDIINDMQSSHELKERMTFQSSVLLELLKKDDFNEYLRYTQNYDKYVKNTIQDKILKRFPSESEDTKRYEDKHIDVCVSVINSAIEKATNDDKIKTLKEFVENMCNNLAKDLVINPNALNRLLFLNNADKKECAKWLKKSVQEMSLSLKQRLAKISPEIKFSKLSRIPQEEIYKDIIGCGEQCPFCGVPCEAGSRAHSEHKASIHRPQALGAYRYDDTAKLVIEICTTSVSSQQSFKCSATQGKWHPYKKYKEIYPNWQINPDNSYDALDYWKYVMAKFNSKLASQYKAKPADIPSTWNEISKSRAEESVKKTYCC